MSITLAWAAVFIWGVYIAFRAKPGSNAGQFAVGVVVACALILALFMLLGHIAIKIGYEV